MLRLKDMVASLGAQIQGDGNVAVNRVASAGLADGDSIVFAEDDSALRDALHSKAAAILVTEELAGKAGETKPLVVMRQPRLGFARVAQLLRSSERKTGVHSTAIVASDAVLAEDVFVDAYAVVGNAAEIGRGTSLGAGSVIGAGVRIGRDCRLYPRVVLYPGVRLGDRVVVHAGAVLGADGFGYVRDAATGEYLQ